MYKIIKKRVLNPYVKSMDVYAPAIARKAEPGQFIILRVYEDGERIPLTIADYDRGKGMVTITFQELGKTTRLLGSMEEGDNILDFVGPLGEATHLERYKKVAVIGGGLGTAIAYPQAKKLDSLGAEVHSIIGFRNKDLIILEEEMKAVSDKVFITTDDGSNGSKGFVTDALQKLIDQDEKYDLVIAIGPLIMMKAVCDLTRKYNIKTIVSMSPIMIDGTGMCGGCRVSVKGETKFACIHGPDFDGHAIDFDQAMKRQEMYKDDEEHECNMDKAFKRNMSLKKVPMIERDPIVRNKDFLEVSLGYTEDLAMEEARRCLQCKHKPCVQGCPVNVQIPEFIQLLAKGDFEGSYKKIKETNALPAVCGRVCPQESQCEELCVRTKKGESVAIGRLERFVADWHMENGKEEKVHRQPNGRKVAIIGSGPAGLSCAGDLAKLGYDVTIFEAFHAAGGVLIYGIPEFRLPQDIVQREIDALGEMGVSIRKNMVIGKVYSIDELITEGFDAIFVGSGAGLPNFMNLPGENLNGVYAANEFLTRINLMKAYKKDADTPIKVGKKVAVIGGGNVAMDAARSAKRLGAEEVSIIYRRSEEELPARLEEVHHAKEEGIDFKLLTNPTRIIGTERGWVKAVECVEMELGQPDDSGRRSPMPIKGSEKEIEVETVIIAIGQSPNPLIKSTTEDLETNKWGGIIVEEDTGLTNKEKVYAGGDVVTGAATVILAMGAGKKAAKAIHSQMGDLK